MHKKVVGGFVKERMGDFVPHAFFVSHAIETRYICECQKTQHILKGHDAEQIYREKKKKIRRKEERRGRLRYTTMRKVFFLP
ncbi:hypothetical protein MBAV_003226, partial [Candidatus Magnetobacterium bavaricum]